MPAHTFAHNFTSIRNPFLSQLAIDADRARGESQLDFSLQIALCSGLNIVRQVNDCEAAGDWTEVASAQFDVATEATIKKVGTNSIKLTSTVAATGYVQTLLIGASAVVEPDPSGIKGQDWRDTQFLGGWQHFATAAHFTTTGDLKVALVNYVDGSGEVLGTKINVPAPTIEDKWQRWEVDISAENRDRVVALRFYNNNADAAEDIYIDGIIRYLFSNGKGPVQGQCAFYPINGTGVITRGNIVQYIHGNSGVEVAAQAAADKVDTAGIAVIGGTGVAGGTVLACVQINGPVYARANEAITDGAIVEWATGHEIDANDTNSEKHGFGKLMNGGNAAIDEDVLIFITPTPTDTADA